MRFVFAVHGTRGDVEPCAAVATELVRRGHEVRIAAPPNMLAFVESVGLAAVPYGPDSVAQLDEDIFRWWQIRNPVSLVTAAREYIIRGWAEMSATLTALTDGADLLVTGQTYQGVAVNIAEHQGIPLAALHYFPHRVNGHLIPFLPPPLVRAAMTAGERGYWRITKKAEDEQRRQLGLPRTTASSLKRIAERRWLEIQAYDPLCFPGLAAEWQDLRRPFVGALTLELPTDNDDAVMSWIAAGTPPVYFGFGSMRVDSPAGIVAMIGEACGQLGKRALIRAGTGDFNSFDAISHPDHVKVIAEANHAAIFPACRAVVHHGGSGTLAAGMRAGIPTLVLWIGAEQPIWSAQVRLLKAGVARRFSTTTSESLVAALRSVLSPGYVARAREIATRMTKPAASVKNATDLLEEAAQRGR